jgi:hypothetical protein
VLTSCGEDQLIFQVIKLNEAEMRLRNNERNGERYQFGRLISKKK